MSTWCCRRGQIVCLQDFFILRLPLVKPVVLPANGGHLKQVSKNLSRCHTHKHTHITKTEDAFLEARKIPKIHTFLPLPRIFRPVSRAIIHNNLHRESGTDAKNWCEIMSVFYLKKISHIHLILYPFFSSKHTFFLMPTPSRFSEVCLFTHRVVRSHGSDSVSCQSGNGKEMRRHLPHSLDAFQREIWFLITETVSFLKQRCIIYYIKKSLCTCVNVFVYLLFHLTKQVHHDHPSFSICVSNTDATTGTRHYQLICDITICQK